MRRISLVFALLAALFAAIPANAEFFSQRFDFAVEKWIRINAKVGDLELRDVQFQFPRLRGPQEAGHPGPEPGHPHGEELRGRADPGAGRHRALRRGRQPPGMRHHGDEDGGNQGGGEESYYVSFDYVNTRLASAKTFYITVETEPDVPQVSDEKPAPKSTG